MNRTGHPLGPVRAAACVGELPKLPSQDPAVLAQHLCNAYEIGAEVDYHRVDRKLWGFALNWLVGQAMLDVIGFAAPRLTLAYPESRYLKTIAAIFARLPPPANDAAFAAFRDDATQEVQIVPRIGANAVLLAFCGGAQKMGIPLNLIHRWFGQLGVHVIYLRDHRRRLFDNGVQSLASDLTGTLQILRKIIANLEVQRVVCYGNSFGGYAALRYAVELPSEAVLSFAGPTNLVPRVGTHPMPRRPGIPAGLNLCALYQHADCAPRAHLVYAEHNVFDRKQASNFADLPTVTLEMVPGATEHNVFLDVLFQGRYERLIQWLVDPYRGAGSP
jgi:pimeloyl-ACP methyl ester carboxylesterase